MIPALGSHATQLHLLLPLVSWLLQLVIPLPPPGCTPLNPDLSGLAPGWRGREAQAEVAVPRCRKRSPSCCSRIQKASGVHLAFPAIAPAAAAPAVAQQVVAAEPHVELCMCSGAVSWLVHAAAAGFLAHLQRLHRLLCWPEDLLDCMMQGRPHRQHHRQHQQRPLAAGYGCKTPALSACQCCVHEREISAACKGQAAGRSINLTVPRPRRCSPAASSPAAPTFLTPFWLVEAAWAAVGSLRCTRLRPRPVLSPYSMRRCSAQAMLICNLRRPEQTVLGVLREKC